MRRISSNFSLPISLSKAKYPSRYPFTEEDKSPYQDNYLSRKKIPFMNSNTTSIYLMKGVIDLFELIGWWGF